MSAPTLLNVCRIHLMDVDDCNLSTLHAHQIIHHMREMIGIVSVTIRGQDIHVVHDPKEATPVQVENYLCAAVHPFGRRWRDAIRAAFRRTRLSSSRGGTNRHRATPDLTNRVAGK